MVVGNPSQNSRSGNVSEKIDERILRLLGLEDVFDLDYDTYFTLLKEATIKYSSIGKEKIPHEEVELLRQELLRIKRNTGKGRFKVNTKKINANKVKATSPLRITKERYFIATPVSVVSPQKLLPSAKSKDKIDKIGPQLGDELENNISAIRKSVESIANILKDQFKLTSKEQDLERKNSEYNKRREKESQLEKKPFEKIQKIITGILAPVKSIWDKIIHFFVMTFLGRVMYKLVGWFGDPKNQGKIQSIIRFVKDWWPALLGSYLLFGTSFGAFVRSITGIVARGLIRLTRFAIPSLLRFIARNKVAAAGIGLFAAGALIPAMAPGTVDEQERETKGAPGSTEDKLKQLEQQKANLNLFEKLQGKGAEIDEQISYLKSGKTSAYASGGFVSGERGVDKIPAMLSDGEFVMSRGAVNKYGVSYLERLNSAGGGTNRPKILSGIPHAAGGGFIGDVEKRYVDPLLNNRDNLVRSLENYARGQSLSGNKSLIGSINNLISTMKNGKSPSFSGPNISGMMGGINQAALSARKGGMGGLLKYGQDQLQNLGRGSGPASFNIVNRGLKSLRNAAGGIKDRLQKTQDSRWGIEKWAEKFEKNDYKKEYAAVTKRLGESDKDIASIYDPKRDTGIGGNIKKLYQDIRNKGAIPDFLKGLKSEGVENLAEKLSGGRIKNLGAKITGLQYAAKGLLGPLGAGFRINNDALKRYTQPAVEYYRKHGQSGVGAAGLGQETYNKFMNDKLANLALGQFSFKVGKDGKARTNDVYDSNKTATQYFKESRKGLRNGNVGEAAFKGLSGVLRILQAKGWANLRPGGSGIVVADNLNKPKTTNAKLGNSKPKSSAPPPPPKQKVVVLNTSKNSKKSGDSASTTKAHSKVPAMSAQHSKGTRHAKATHGIK